MREDQMLAQDAAAAATQRGTYSRVAERLQWSYYATAILAVATTSHRLFTQPLGSAAQPTLAETNLPTSGIPNMQKFIVRNLKIIYYRLTAATLTELNYLSLVQMIERSVITLRVTGKDALLQIPMGEFFGQSMLGLIAPTAAGDNYPLLSTGRGVGIYPMNIPLVLQAMTPIECEILHTQPIAAGLAGDRIKVIMEGKLLRLA